jgi:amino acid adenylation domain-containing protein
VTSVQQRAVRDIYRLTPMQEGMLFHALSSPAGAPYLQQHVVDVTGVDADRLGAAVVALIDRHDVLRTGFVWEGVDRPVQVVFASAPSPLTFGQPPGEDATAVDAAVEAALDHQRATGFDLRRPPLLAMHAIPLRARCWRVVTTHHHLVMDGWSVPILHAELAALLRAEVTGEPARLGPAGRFHDFVRRLGDTGEDPYWRERFGDCAGPTPLGADRVGRVSRPDHATPTGRVIRLRRTGPVSELDAVARRHGLLPSTIVHAAWALLLSRYADQPDTVFGITLSGRSTDLPGAHGRVGMFINSLPLRISCTDERTVRDWLAEVQEQLARVRDREQGSLADIARVSRVAPGRPMYETVFAFQNYWHDGMDTHDGGGVTVRLVASRERTSVPVAVAVALPAGGVWIRLDYDTARLDEPVAQAMVESYLDIVAALLDACAGAPSAVPGEARLGEVRLGEVWCPRPVGAGGDGTAVDETLAREVGPLAGARVLVRPGVPAAAAGWLGDTGTVPVERGGGRAVDIVIGTPQQVAALEPAPRVRIFLSEGPVRVPADGVNLRLFVHNGRITLARLVAPDDGGRIGGAPWLSIRDGAGRPAPYGAVGRLYAGDGEGEDTGLRARVRVDGDIDVLGTGDGTGGHADWVARQVAILPQVRDATVVEYQPGHPVAWVVAADATLTAAQVLAHLNRLVPPELLPAEVEIVDRLPVDDAGRLNRDALRAPQPGPAVRPATPLRARLDALDPGRRRALLDALAHRPVRRPRDDHPVPVDEAQRATLLDWGRGPGAPVPEPVPETVRAVAARRPDAVAIDGPDGTTTYADLVTRAATIARWLRGRGVGVDDRVAVYLPRGTAMVSAALGVLMAGAAYVPVDLAWPAQRLSRVLADARAAAALTDRAHRDRFEGLATCCVDEPPDDEPAAAEPVVPPHPRSAAYVIYTSGSTGTPKGVVVEHGALANFARQIALAYHIGAGTRLLGFASLTFDISVFDIWTALTAGATLVLAGDAERRSADDLLRLLRDKRVEAAELPPSLLPLLDQAALPELRLLSVGGEAPAAALVDTWATPERELWNGYGPTETTVAVTLFRCRPPSGGRVPPIGRPMPNHRVYVLDDRLRLVPPGEPGELCVAGAGLARGYLGAPGQTASRFVPDPFAPVPGARMYRTGDLVRWDGDGQLEFLGRVDRQVKVRGFRVELAEVESVLAADPRIRQVAVEPRQGTLIAYVVPAAGDLRVDAVRDIAAARLPDYMVPGNVAFLDALPVTAHGKVDREALAGVPLAEQRPTVPQRGALAPATGLERAIMTDILAPLLGVADLTRGDDFFRLGGNSLQAMQVTARVRDRFGVDVSLADFFVEPTGQRLAVLVQAALARRGQEDDDLYAEATTAVAPDRPTALGYPQERLWRMNELEPGHPSHHAPLALRLSGPLNIAALRSAIELIVRRHAPLRARFTADEQTFAPPAAVPVVIVDTDEATARQLVSDEAARPFDLRRGPLLRVHLYRLGPDDQVLQWNVHHIVTDGWSIGVMLGELFTAYNAAIAGAPPPLSPLPAHYRDFVEWQRRFVAGPDYPGELAWWRTYLDGIRPDAAPPADRRDGAFRFGWRNVRLDQATGQAAVDLSRSQGVTLFMATLGAWSLALSADTSTDELPVVVPLAGRQRSEWEPLIGYFVNRVVVRVPLGADLSFAGLMHRLREETARTFAHQDVPFEELIRELRVPPTAVPVNFSVQNAPQSAEGLRGLGITPFADASGRDFTPIMELYSPVGAKFEASLVLRQRGDAIAGGLEYNAAHFTAERADIWARRFETILTRAAAEPDTPLPALARIARQVEAR